MTWDASGAGYYTVSAGVLVVLLVAACKGEPAKPADPLVACRTALATPRADDVDGGLGARVLSDVAKVLEDPAQGLVWG